MLATVAKKLWTVWRLDVQTAFLYADVEEEMWGKMSPGHETKDKVTGAPLVMKLLEPLYGLKQSDNNWHGTIDPSSWESGPKPSKATRVSSSST